MVRKIISGGQTGADIGGVRAGVILGLETGGMMPKGWRTEVGPRPDYELLYKMQEHSSRNYRYRTEHNVKCSDGTLVFGNSSSPGSKLTKNCCRESWKPCFIVEWPMVKPNIDKFRNWLQENEIDVLNVAGNREEKSPGIYQAVIDFLVEALK